MSERLLSARCRVHGSDPCEVFSENLASQKERKRHHKESRRTSKRVIQDALDEDDLINQQDEE